MCKDAPGTGQILVDPQSQGVSCVKPAVVRARLASRYFGEVNKAWMRELEVCMVGKCRA